MDNEQIVENIFNTLSSRRFEDWYHDGGEFDQWIAGDEDAPTKEEIKQQIKQIFNIK